MPETDKRGRKIENSPSKALAQLQAFDCAVVDCCSLIYMSKAGFLDQAAASFTLIIPDRVEQEFGEPLPQCIRVRREDCGLPADTLLVRLAEWLATPIISEDRRVLLEARRRRLPYFNALMVLNRLRIMHGIDSSRYNLFFARLKETARYSSRVLAFGAEVLALSRRGVHR